MVTRLCLYGTDAQRQKLNAARGERHERERPLERVERQEREAQCEVEALRLALQVAAGWIQEALGCRRLPVALSKDFLQIFRPSIATICFRCSVQEKLQKALKHLSLAHLEVERQSEALAEQYALAQERMKSAQLAAKLER